MVWRERGRRLRNDGGVEDRVEMELALWGILRAGTCRCDRAKRMGDGGVEGGEWKLIWHLQVCVVSELLPMEQEQVGRPFSPSVTHLLPVLLV